jgi:hypothetical protein
MASDLSEDDLRRRYLDWCSTRVAKRFIELSHDEVWLRSHFAATLAAGSGGSLEPAPADFPPLDRIPNYLEVVRSTTLLVAREMNLPPFSEWRTAYLADPRPFDTEILSAGKTP